MMSDDEILLVVRAHKEGKKIQQRDRDHRELGWRECPFPNWDFYRVDFRVAPEPRKPKEYWIDGNASNGPWTAYNYNPSYPSGSLEQRCLVHVREVDDGATSGELTEASDTAKTFHEPREWEVVEVGEGSITSSSGFEPESEVIRVREVLE